jgi:hypothetical protein
MMSTYIRINDNSTVSVKIPDLARTGGVKTPYIDILQVINRGYAGSATIWMDRLEDAQALLDAAQAALQFFADKAAHEATLQTPEVPTIELAS